jgi:O-antigen/teichoic acid export membrane protein
MATARQNLATFRSTGNAILSNAGDLLRAAITQPVLFRSALPVLVLRMSGAVLAVASAVLLARFLGKDGYGIYAWALATFSLLAMPIQQALPMLVVRETARADAERDWRRMRGLWRWSTGISLATSAVMTLCVLVAASYLVDDVHFRTLAYAAALMPLLALGNLRGAALRGLRHVVTGQLPELIIRPAGFLALMIAASASIPAGGKWAPDTAMATHLVAAGITFVIGLMLLLIRSPRSMQAERGADYCHREWASSMFPLTMTSILQAMNQNIAVLALSAFATDADVGIYAATATLAALVSFGLQITSLSTAQHVARLHTQRRWAALQTLAKNTSIATLAFALPIASTFFVAGDLVLQHAYGPHFIAGRTTLAILAFGQLVNAGAGSVGMLLVMTGNERLAASSLGWAVLTNAAATVVAVPMLGVTGAGVATTVSLITWNVLMWRAVRRTLGIETFGLLSWQPPHA